MINKKVAVISYHTCPLTDEAGIEVGGMNVYVLELSKQLAKKGYIIDIYTRSQSIDSEKVVQVAENLRVIHLKAGEEVNLPKNELRHYIPEFLENFYKFIEKEKIDYEIVSCHYYLSGLIGMDIKEKKHIPFLITFHTLGLLKNLVARDTEEREDIERIKAELMLVQIADQVIATSNADAQYIETLYNGSHEKIAVLTPGIDLEHFKPMDKSAAKKHIGVDLDSKLILFVGRIEPLKGIDVLLYAIKILLEKKPELKICLWIVGGDVSQAKESWSKELQKLETIKQLLHITAAVQFVGQKKQEELPNYYNAAEITVMPSQYESFGITVLEAMACGVPVITTDVTGISGLLDKKHSALITSANNPILLASKIFDLLTDKAVYEISSKHVYKRVQDLSWERVAQRFISLCKSCQRKSNS